MGQYFISAVKLKKESDWTGFHPHDFGNGAKLLEMCYFGDYSIMAILHSIRNHPMQVVISGDYVENSDGSENVYDSAKRVSDIDECQSLMEKCDEMLCGDMDTFPHIIYNIDKNEFIDLFDYTYMVDEIYHPLMLCVEDNEKDYDGKNIEQVGRWKKDELVFLNSDEFFLNADIMKKNPVKITPIFERCR